MKPWMKMMISLVLGVVFGLLISGADWMIPYQPRITDHLGLLGKGFIDLLKMLVGLLIFCSLVTGICHINDPKKLGRIGVYSFSFFALSTSVAITLGVAITSWIKPGQGLHLVAREVITSVSENHLLEFILGAIPSNPIAAFANGNILQIIVFAVLFAVAMVIAGEKGQKVLGVIESTNDVMCILTNLVMKCAPYGVFVLMASAVSAIGWKVVLPLLLVIACNYLCCFIQIFAVFGLVLKYLIGIRLVSFFQGMKEAILVAITTCSSAATLPVSLECIRQRLGVSKELSAVVMALGSTINMNGAAIGQAVAAIFIAQAYHIEMTWFKIAILFTTALMSAIGAAGIPGTGLIMLSVVLNAIGLPLEGIALVAGVDRLREMMSTVTNILGDAVATLYVAKKEQQFEKQSYRVLTT
ncbi:MAG: dicarboxylate/amino acid:cation symporter [Chlamydiota bacterium]